MLKVKEKFCELIRQGMLVESYVKNTEYHGDWFRMDVALDADHTVAIMVDRQTAISCGDYFEPGDIGDANATD